MAEEENVVVQAEIVTEETEDDICEKRKLRHRALETAAVSLCEAAIGGSLVGASISTAVKEKIIFWPVVAGTMGVALLVSSIDAAFECNEYMEAIKRYNEKHNK